jgi:tetraacyldisaccharide 4'-kinase
VARAALSGAAAVYGVGVGARNALYRTGLRSSRRVGAPVISVGNITAGGTGKTPFVAWLAHLLVIHKLRPAILSRGYGRHGGLDDENRMLAEHVPGVPIVVDPRRVRGAETAIREHGAEVLVLDDGFQHRRIARDLDIVLVDALWPFGAGHLLPRGLLREPLKELARADLLLVTRTELVDAERLDDIKGRLRELAPRTPVACAAIRPHGLRPLRRGGGESLGVEFLKERRWAAFCGIGNPEAFGLTLERAGCEVAFLEAFADHEPYSASQIGEVVDRAHAAGCERIVTTEKDAVKVAPLLSRLPAPHLYALQTDLEFADGAEELTAAVLEAVGLSP